MQRFGHYMTAQRRLQLSFIHTSWSLPKLVKVFTLLYLGFDSMELLRSTCSYMLYRNHSLSIFFHLITLDFSNFWSEHIGLGLYLRLLGGVGTTAAVIALASVSSRKLRMGMKPSLIMDIACGVLIMYLTIFSLSFERYMLEVVELTDNKSFIIVEVLYTVVMLLQVWLSTCFFMCQGGVMWRQPKDIIIFDWEFENVHFFIRYALVLLEVCGKSGLNQIFSYTMKVVWYLFMFVSTVNSIPYHNLTINILRSALFLISCICSFNILTLLVLTYIISDNLEKFNWLIVSLTFVETVVGLALMSWKTLKNWHESRNFLSKHNMHNRYNNTVNIPYIIKKFSRSFPRRFLGGLMFNLIDEFDPNDIYSSRSLIKFIKELFRNLFFQYGSKRVFRHYYLSFLSISGDKEQARNIYNYLNHSAKNHVLFRDRHYLISCRLNLGIYKTGKRETKISNNIRKKIFSYWKATVKLEQTKEECESMFALLQELIYRKSIITNRAHASGANRSVSELTLSGKDSITPLTQDESSNSVLGNDNSTGAPDKKKKRKHHYSKEVLVDTSSGKETSSVTVNDRNRIVQNLNNINGVIGDGVSSDDTYSIVSVRLKHNDPRFMLLNDVPDEALPRLDHTLNQLSRLLCKLDKNLRKFYEIYVFLLIYLDENSVHNIASLNKNSFLSEAYFYQIISWELLHVNSQEADPDIRTLISIPGRHNFSNDTMQAIKQYIRKRMQTRMNGEPVIPISKYIYTARRNKAPSFKKKSENSTCVGNNTNGVSDERKRMMNKESSRVGVDDNDYITIQIGDQYRRFKANDVVKRAYIQSKVKVFRKTGYYKEYIKKRKLDMKPLPIIISVIFVIIVVACFTVYALSIWNLSKRKEEIINSSIALSRLAHNTQMRNFDIKILAAKSFYKSVKGFDDINLGDIQNSLFLDGMANLNVIHTGFGEIASEQPFLVWENHNEKRKLDLKLLLNDKDECGINYVDKSNPLTYIIGDSRQLISLSYLNDMGNLTTDNTMSKSDKIAYFSDMISSLAPSFDAITYKSLNYDMRQEHDYIRYNKELFNTMKISLLVGWSFILLFSLIIVLSTVNSFLQPIVGILEMTLTKFKSKNPNTADITDDDNSSIGEQTAKNMIWATSERFMNTFLFKIMYCLVKIVIFEIFLSNNLGFFINDDSVGVLSNNMCNFVGFTTVPLNIIHNSVMSDYALRRYISDGNIEHINKALNSNIVVNGHYSLVSEIDFGEEGGETFSCVPLFTKDNLNIFWKTAQMWELLRYATLKLAFKSVLLGDLSEKSTIVYETSKFLLAKDGDTKTDAESLILTYNMVDKLLSDYSDGILCDRYSYTTVTSLKSMYEMNEKGIQSLPTEAKVSDQMLYIQKEERRFFDSIYYNMFSRSDQTGTGYDSLLNMSQFYSTLDADVSTVRETDLMIHALPAVYLNSEWYMTMKKLIYSDTYNLMFNQSKSLIQSDSISKFIQFDLILFILLIFIFFQEWVGDTLIWKHKKKHSVVMTIVFRALINVFAFTGIIFMVIMHIIEQGNREKLSNYLDIAESNTISPIVSIYLLALRLLDNIEVCTHEASKYLLGEMTTDIHSCVAKSAFMLEDMKTLCASLDSLEYNYSDEIIDEFATFTRDIEKTLILLYPFSVYYGGTENILRFIKDAQIIRDIFYRGEGKLLFESSDIESMSELDVSISDFLQNNTTYIRFIIQGLYSDEMEAKIQNLGDMIIELTGKEYYTKYQDIMNTRKDIERNSVMTQFTFIWNLVSIFIFFLFMIITLPQWLIEAKISKLNPMPQVVYKEIPRREFKYTFNIGLLLGVLSVGIFLIPLITLVPGAYSRVSKSQENEFQLQQASSSALFLANSILNLAMGDSVGDGASKDLSVFDKEYLFSTFLYAVEEFEGQIASLEYNKQVLLENLSKKIKAKYYPEEDINYAIDTANHISPLLHRALDCIDKVEKLNTTSEEAIADSTRYVVYTELNLEEIQNTRTLYCFQDDILSGTHDWETGSPIQNDEIQTTELENLIMLLGNTRMDSSSKTILSSIEDLSYVMEQNAESYKSQRTLVYLTFLVFLPLVVFLLFCVIVLLLRSYAGKNECGVSVLRLWR